MRTQIPAEKRQVKLSQLVDSEGYPELEELLRDATFDSACPGICLTDGCDYTTEVEPDQDRGWCATRGASSVWTLTTKSRSQKRHGRDGGSSNLNAAVSR